jgi:hypothetical protein
MLAEVHPQSIVKGRVTDKKGEPLTGANIYFNNTYEGCTSDTEGRFMIKTGLIGNQQLMVSYLGYESYVNELDLSNSKIELDIKLKESSNSINAAVINAGSFEASDKKKSVIMKSLDIVTTASSEGDIYGAINTLPGTQVVGETGRLFVRGGTSHETKTFMDGMMVQCPYTSNQPDIPVRGRFSPFLFNGMIFSTGAYSAEYGQALSSALILNTNALADEDLTSISLLSVGCGASYTKRWENSSISGSLDYANLTPYFKIIKHDLNWDKEPESIGGTMVIRKRIRKEGLIKAISSLSHSKSGLYYTDYTSGSDYLINLMNDDFYLNATYNDMLSDKWMVKGGVAFNYDMENIDINNEGVNDDIRVFQSRFSFVNFMDDYLSIKFGSEILSSDYQQDYYDNHSVRSNSLDFTNNITSAFLECDLKGGNNIAARIGGRLEHSSLLDETRIVPRLSVAYKTGDKSQVSLGYGIFYQVPHNDYIKFNHRLQSEKASHYIINYQYRHDDRTLRIETYYKNYDKLVKYDNLNSYDPGSYNNMGFGYARGIDIFWRDKKTFRYADYWISYSFIDTERDFEDFAEPATPTFISNHNLSVVLKYWISRLNNQVSLTYRFASGRPYYNPNNEDFLGDRTRSYQNLSVNSSYLTELFGNFTIIHLSVNNLFGFKNVFGYTYSNEPDANGIFKAHPVGPYAKRTFIIAIFISIK